MESSSLNVSELSVAYRRLVLWVGVQLVVAVGGGIAVQIVGPSPLGVTIALARLIGVLVTVVALVLYAYRTAVALGSRVGVLWAVAMLVPFLNLITLLLLSSRATKACRAAGVPVGFLGPKI